MSAFGLEIEKDAVCIFGAGISKHDALDSLVDRLTNLGAVEDREALERAMYEREAIMSTGIGSGVAIPHVRIKEISRPTVGVGISREGIDFDTLDNEPVNVVVLFAMPARSQKEYLGLLAQVMLSLRTPGFRDRLLACKTPDEVAHILNEDDSRG